MATVGEVGGYPAGLDAVALECARPLGVCLCGDWPRRGHYRSEFEIVEGLAGRLRAAGVPLRLDRGEPLGSPLVGAWRVPFLTAYTLAAEMSARVEVAEGGGLRVAFTGEAAVSARADWLVAELVSRSRLCLDQVGSASAPAVEWTESPYVPRTWRGFVGRGRIKAFTAVVFPRTGAQAGYVSLHTHLPAPCGGTWPEETHPSLGAVRKRAEQIARLFLWHLSG